MTKAKTKIPKFKSIAEEAAFWDSHDTTEFEQEMKPVKVKPQIHSHKKGKK